jgi:hypothetical protein
MTDGGERLCGCGCGKPLPANAVKRRKYLEGHRDRAYRKRVREAARAAHVPERLSLSELAQASTSTPEASADAQKGRERPRRRSPRPGVALYFRDPAWAEAVAEYVALAAPSGTTELRHGHEVLESALARHRAKRP